MKRQPGCYDPLGSDGDELCHFKFFIFLEAYNLMSFEYEEKFDTKKGIVSNGIRICVECGTLAILIDNHNIFCKECNLQFKVKEKR